MKKSISVLLVALLLLGVLAGCSNDSPSTSQADSPTETSANETEETTDVSDSKEAVNIVFWHSMGGSNGEALDELVKRYNESQDKVFVTAEYQGSYDDALTKLRSASTAADAGVDIVQVYEIGSRFLIDSGWVVTMQDYIDKDGFDVSVLEPNLLAYYTIDGRLNSMPFNSSTPLLYYNVEIFEEAGIEEPPKSLEEIYEISEDLMEKGGAEMALAAEIYSWYIEQMLYKAASPMYNNDNGREASPTECIINEDGALEEIFAQFLRLEEAGYAPNIGTSQSGEFASGIAAMKFASTAGLYQTINDVGDKFTVGTAYFPGALKEYNDGGVSIGGASLWMMKTNDEVKKDASWDFIKFVVNAESQAFWNAKTGYFPINIHAHDEPEFKDNIADYPQFETAINQLHDSSAESQGALSPIFQESRQIIQTEMENMYNGMVTPAEAAENAEESINKALDEYNRANQ